MPAQAVRRIARMAVSAAGLCGLLFQAAAPRADVVVLRNGRAYAGHIAQSTSRSVELFDGNLRRVFTPGDIEEMIHERPDTSWVIVGDRMVRQRDWEAASTAYRRALELTDQSAVLLRRLAQLRSFRFDVPGGREAEALLAGDDWQKAAQALAGVVARAQTAAQRHHWTDLLARAYVGLSEQNACSTTAQVDPYLVYALAIAPACGPAHTLLGERLAAAGYGDIAEREFLLALDLEPLDERARAALARMGKPWTYEKDENDRSGLRQWIERRPAVAPAATAPATTTALAQLLQRRVARLGKQPARLLIAAYLLDATVALAYEGALPYPGYEDVIPAVLKETATPAPAQTPHDVTFIRLAIEQHIDPRFVRALAGARSAHDSKYIAPDGSRGLIPLRRSQWAIAGRVAGVDWPFERDALEPEKNVQMACRYFDWLRHAVLSPYVGNRLDRLERVHDNL